MIKNGKKIAIRKILGGSKNGLHLQLVSGALIWLPKSQTDIQIDDNGQRVAIIPGWLKTKITAKLHAEQ